MLCKPSLCTRGVMKYSSATAIVIVIAVTTGSARADTVTDWNQTALEVLKVGGSGAIPARVRWL